MRDILLGLLLVNGGMAAALAADTAPLDHYYGNTWELRRPEEMIVIYVNADGTWDGIFQGVFRAGKTWRIDGELVCFVSPPDEPDVEEPPPCFRGLTGRKIGETWKTVMEGQQKVWDSTVRKGRSVPPLGGKQGG